MSLTKGRSVYAVCGLHLVPSDTKFSYVSVSDDAVVDSVRCRCISSETLGKP